jgi:Ty3 transposon capsid-like protein
MTNRIASQIHDFIARHGSPLAPPITSTAALEMSSGHRHTSGSGRTTTVAAATPTTNGILAGLLPTIFTGERTESDKFLKEFKQWRLLNHDHTEMKQLYNRVLMALIYIKGPKVDNWQEAWLEELTSTNLHPDDEALWTNFEQKFKDAYTNSNKKRAAYNKLMTLQMKGGDIDTYITTFNNLLAKAGWTREEEAVDFFQKGLEDGVKWEVLRRQAWPVTLQEWQEAARDETNRYKAQQLLLGQKSNHLPYQNFTHDIACCNWMAKLQQQCRDPNMMDIDTAEIQAQCAYPSPQLWEERRCRGQCMQYGQMGHIMKNCPHGYPSKWNKQLANPQFRQTTYNWNLTPQPNHMPHQPIRPPQYTPGKTRNQNTTTRVYNQNIIDDRSPMQTPIQVHPTTNPGEAEQILDGMMQDQPMHWRDINQQDFPWARPLQPWYELNHPKPCT